MTSVVCADPDCRQHPCDSCGGDGFFEDFYIASDHSTAADWTECRRCSGTGWIDTEPAGPEHTWDGETA